MESLFTETFLAPYKEQTPPWGFNGLGEIVYRRTYARRIEHERRTEEWFETIKRCIDGAQTIGAQYTEDEAQRLFDYMFNLKCSFSGRALWQLGTRLGSQYGDSLNNCWSVAIRKPSDFVFLFDELLMGGGVGFSVRRADINELPRVRKGITVEHERTNDADFIVPDSREGWAQLLQHALDAYFTTGKSFTYSTILVRGAGEPIKGFGGVASGPLPLIKGIEQISGVLRSREGKKLRSVDVLDICNIIGSVVVSGNVRRSAQIAIGDADDALFLHAKDWGRGTIPNWRAFSNNTIEADTYAYLGDSFWQGYEGNGEPYGLFNKQVAQRYGRIGELVEDTCEIPNPCAEIILNSYESCNLAEIFLNNVNSQEEMAEIAKLLYKTQKAISQMPYIHKESEAIIHKNARLGLGITGICQSLNKLSWLDTTYRALKDYDRYWSAKRGWPVSIKLTTTKPSGTLSLLAGATPGVHPAYARHYVRRVRMNTNDPLVQYCRDAGYPIEFSRGFDGTEDHTTSIVSFPCEAGNDALVASNMSAVQQLELYRVIQSQWSDNSVSVTVYYRREELPAIQAWLKEHYDDSVKSVSFLLHSEHGFDQAPYEEITPEEYNLRRAMVRHARTVISVDEDSMIDLDECATGACPIR